MGGARRRTVGGFDGAEGRAAGGEGAGGWEGFGEEGRGPFESGGEGHGWPSSRLRLVRRLNSRDETSLRSRYGQNLPSIFRMVYFSMVP